MNDAHVNGATTAPVVDRPVLDPAARHGPANEFVNIVEDSTEADPVALLCQLLALVGNAIGRAVYRFADGTQHFLNLFIALIGDTSSGRKGTSLNHAIGFMRLVDPGWVTGCISNGVVSGEGVIWRLRDPIQREVEGVVVVEDPGVTDKRCCLVETEWAAVLRVCQRQQNNLSSTLRDFWDGKAIVATMAKNSPAHATNAHVSLIGHCTPDEVKRNLTTIEISNGYANRHQFFLVERSKILPFGGEKIPRDKLQALALKFQRALETARRGGGELGFAEPAREIWKGVYEGLTRSKPGLLGNILARAAAQVLRLSSLYAVLDGDREIKAAHLLAGLALWKYSEASVRKLFGDLTGNADADGICAALRSQPGGLTRTEISNLFARNLSAARIEAALAALLGFGLVRFESERRQGRSAERWYALAKT